MVKDLVWTKENDGSYTAQSYPLDDRPGFYSEYRVFYAADLFNVGVHGWIWQDVSVTWDDEDQVTECINAESQQYFTEPMDAQKDANDRFRKGQVNTNPLEDLPFSDPTEDNPNLLDVDEVTE